MIDMGYNSEIRIENQELIKIKSKDVVWGEKYLSRENLYAVRSDGEGTNKEYLILLQNEADFEYAVKNYRHEHWYKEIRVSHVPRIDKNI